MAVLSPSAPQLTQNIVERANICTNQTPAFLEAQTRDGNLSGRFFPAFRKPPRLNLPMNFAYTQKVHISNEGAENQT